MNDAVQDTEPTSPYTSPAAGLVEQIYREHHARIVRLIAYRFGSGIAEDIASKVFEKLLEGRMPDPGRPVWPWLRRVALNQALDHLRTNRVHETIDAANDLSHHRDEAEDVVRRLVVRNALDQLSTVERDAVVSSVAGTPTTEVARTHGRTPQAVHTIACRTRKRLRSLLEPAMLPVYGALAWLRRTVGRADLGGVQYGIEAVAIAIVVLGAYGGALTPRDVPLEGAGGSSAASIAVADRASVPPTQLVARGAVALAPGARVEPQPDAAPREARLVLEERDGGAAPTHLVVERPSVATPFGPVGGGRTEVECNSNGFEVLPRTDDAYRLC